MKKIFIFAIFLVVLPLAFSGVLVVSPEVSINASVQNQASFDLPSYLNFTSYDQDAIVNWGDSENSMTIQVPANSSETFWLNYINSSMPGGEERQCEFEISTTAEGDATLQVTSLPDAFVTCALEGDVKDQNLRLLVGFKSSALKNYLKGLNNETS